MASDILNAEDLGPQLGRTHLAPCKV